VTRSASSTSTAKAGLAALAVAGVLDLLRLFALGTEHVSVGRWRARNRRIDE